jgi:hypothetical protein
MEPGQDDRSIAAEAWLQATEERAQELAVQMNNATYAELKNASDNLAAYL